MENKIKFLIHLKDGDVVHIGGIPYEVMGDADFGGNTSPEITGIPKEKWEEVKEN